MTVVHRGVRWQVQRAWPDDEDSIAVELGLGAGAVRGGYWRRGGCEILDPGVDPRLPALAEARAAGGPAEHGVVISHRPGKRAVVRTGDGHFVKVLRPGRAGTVLTGIAAAQAFSASFRMPEVLGSTPSTVIFAELAGRPLHSPAGWSPKVWRQAWSDTLAAWRTTVMTPQTSLPGDGTSHRVHDAAAEVAVLRRWVEAATGAGALPADGLASLVEQVVTELLQGIPSPVVACHRDLHDHQLLWDPALGPGVLDVDTACLGEAALDLGNLRAHARWRHRQGRWPADSARIVASAVDRVAEQAAVDPARLAAYEHAALLRLACVHSFRPGDRAGARQLPTLVTDRPDQG